MFTSTYNYMYTCIVPVIKYHVIPGGSESEECVQY